MQKIGNIFSEIQEGASVSNSNIYSLIDEFSKNSSNFINGLEQCYLKILKMGSKSNKKPVEKFEKVTEKFFNLLHQESLNEKSKKKITTEDVYGNAPFYKITKIQVFYCILNKFLKKSKNRLKVIFSSAHLNFNILLLNHLESTLHTLFTPF